MLGKTPQDEAQSDLMGLEEGRNMNFNYKQAIFIIIFIVSVAAYIGYSIGGVLMAIVCMFAIPSLFLKVGDTDVKLEEGRKKCGTCHGVSKPVEMCGAYESRIKKKNKTFK